MSRLIAAWMGVLVACAGLGAGAEAPRARGTAGEDPFVGWVRSACVAAMEAGREKPSAGVGAAKEVADGVAGWASARQLEAVGWGEGTLNLLSSAGRAGLGSVADHPEFALELGLLMGRKDGGEAVVRLARRLCDERGAQVDAFPALAAAVCVVHEKPLERQINENLVKAPDALEVFDFFVRNNSRMQMDLSRSASLLLVHVVDVTERVDQLEWALRTYGAAPQPGERFFEIVYDTDAFRQGKEKKVTAAGGYCLESIKKYGGVCADQAYFAEDVGKACGVPTVYVTASGADVAHAWIGYLETRGRGGWDFDHGRYEAYQNLRGQVGSPQTGERIADADVGLLGGLVSCSAEEIRATMGAALAARRMSVSGWRAGEIEDLGESKGVLRKARTGEIGDRLDLLQAAMTRCAAVPAAWTAVRDFARAGEMDRAGLDVWAKAVDRMCGNRFADFSFDTVSALIASEKDVRARQGMWEWAFGRYKARPDLASAVRFEQGAMFEEAGDPGNAWAAYEDVVKNFLNDGPMAVRALWGMRGLLERNGKREQMVGCLQDAAKRVKKPGGMAGAFMVQSNFYKINAMLAEELDLAGRGAEARSVREKAGIKGG